MGDPRKTRSKYKSPRHPWNKERIEREKKITYDYGLVNKKELWKAESKLKTYKDNIKKLIAQSGPQAEKELGQLFAKLKNYGIVGNDASADEVLGLQSEQLLDRRLQTIVFKKEMAHTMKQARQFITHGHILINGKKITVPGYLVPLNEQSNIEFNTNSSLFSTDHPERVVKNKAPAAASSTPSAENKTANEKAEETAPVVATEETSEEEKPIEQKIEEETDNAKEVAQAVEEAEADTIAKDHKENVEEAAKTEDKDQNAEEQKTEKPKEDAQ